MLSLKRITLSQGNKTLITESTFDLYAKQKIGLVGPNGCGKSSLFQLILGHLTADEGSCEINPHLRISHLSQEIPNTEEPALQFVLRGDKDYFQLQQRLIRAEQTGNDEDVMTCHDTLSHTGGYAKPALAAALMNGLGFKASDQQLPVHSFSGGWQMRLNLAHCLMKPADLFLLDEPTNHLDMETIIWLEEWLKQSPASVLVISHDRDFLDGFTTHILHISQEKLHLYTGNYSQFEQTRAEQLAIQQRQHEKQQQQIQHMMDFVQRFKAKATKAKQAQSRLKAIERMELVAQVQSDSPFSFQFYTGKEVSNPLIRCEEIVCGYDANHPILNAVNFVLQTNDRIALLGPNGEGKSTFIKTLMGGLPTLSGQIYRSTHLKIGYYAQHQLDDLDMHLSPLQTIQQLATDSNEQTVRTFLGGFNFIGDMATVPIEHFSGGEKARLALAKLVWQKPNLLLLDEPTNHLDLEMRSAIELALQTYEGAVILISHDRYFLNTTADTFYLVYQKQVKHFAENLSDYYDWLTTQKVVSSEEATLPDKGNEYRERKTLQNRLKKLEQEIDSLQNQLKGLKEQLEDPKLYETHDQQVVSALLKEQKMRQDELLRLEDEWLVVMGVLD